MKHTQTTPKTKQRLMYDASGNPVMIAPANSGLRILMLPGIPVPFFPAYELIREAGILCERNSRRFMRQYVSECNCAKALCEGITGDKRNIWIVNTQGMVELLEGIGTTKANQLKGMLLSTLFDPYFQGVLLRQHLESTLFQAGQPC